MIPMFSIRDIQERTIEKRESNLDILFFEQQVVQQSEPQKIILPKPAVNFKSIQLLKKELKLEKHPFFKGNRSERVVDWINNCVIILEEEDNMKVDGILQYYKILKVFYFYESDHGIRGKYVGTFYPEPKYWMNGVHWDKKTLPELRDYILQILHENEIPYRVRTGSII